MEKKLNQRGKILETLKLYEGKRIDFRFFRYKGISEPGSRISELRSREKLIIPNDFIIDKKTGQKQSYYSLNPTSTLEEALTIGSTIKSDFSF